MSALCLLSCSRQSVRTEETVAAPAKPYTVLLVFADPRCGDCIRDEPIVDSMRDGIHIIFYSWRDRYMVESYNVRRVPLYVLSSDFVEIWRTNSAVEARDRLGLAP